MMSPASVPEVLQSLSAQFAALLALLLIVAGLHKLIWSDRSRRAIHEFAGVHRSWAAPAAVAISLTELLAGVLLWLPAWRAMGAAVAAMIWCGYLLLILRSIANGRRDVDCGCSFGRNHGPLGRFQAGRNAVLSIMAASIAVISIRAGAVPIAVSQVPAGFALLALYCALDQVMTLHAPRAGELL